MQPVRGYLPVATAGARACLPLLLPLRHALPHVICSCCHSTAAAPALVAPGLHSSLLCACPPLAPTPSRRPVNNRGVVLLQPVSFAVWRCVCTSSSPAPGAPAAASLRPAHAVPGRLPNTWRSGGAPAIAAGGLRWPDVVHLPAGRCGCWRALLNAGRPCLMSGGAHNARPRGGCRPLAAGWEANSRTISIPRTLTHPSVSGCLPTRPARPTPAAAGCACLLVPARLMHASWPTLASTLQPPTCPVLQDGSGPARQRRPALRVDAVHGKQDVRCVGWSPHRQDLLVTGGRLPGPATHCRKSLPRSAHLQTATAPYLCISPPPRPARCPYAGAAGGTLCWGTGGRPLPPAYAFSTTAAPRRSWCPQRPGAFANAGENRWGPAG